MRVEDKINQLLQQMAEGWRQGSGAMFAQPFAKEARFVAFDGSIHRGPQEIAAFHQKAFDTFLKGTSIEATIDEIRQIDRNTWLVFTTGWRSPAHSRMRNVQPNPPTSSSAKWMTNKRSFWLSKILVCAPSPTKRPRNCGEPSTLPGIAQAAPTPRIPTASRRFPPTSPCSKSAGR